MKRESNSINFWLGGTSEKIIEKYRKFQNNFVMGSTIFTDNSKILTFYPTSIKKDKFNSDFKLVYISENKEITNIKSLKIWEEYKYKILDNLNIIDDENFWIDIVDIKNDLLKKFILI